MCTLHSTKSHQQHTLNQVLICIFKNRAACAKKIVTDIYFPALITLMPCFLIVAPKIIMPEFITIKAGQKLRIEAHVAGKPAPICKWMKNEEGVIPSSRLVVHKTKNTSVIIIKDVSRKDSGYYSLSAENSCGIATQKIRVVIMGL